MKIVILGAGKMGLFFADILAPHHDVAVFDNDSSRLRFCYQVRRFGCLEEIGAFCPDMVLNAVTLNHTIEAFEEVLPHLPEKTILSDIASVKEKVSTFYGKCGHPYVSTHPMFGPTFADLKNLRKENAIIISEGEEKGRNFFRELYQSLGLKLTECSFEEHDRMAASSLSVPYISTFLFMEGAEQITAAGTTYKRHLAIAEGLLNEDNNLLQEILFNPYTLKNIDVMQEKIAVLSEILRNRDGDKLREYLKELRNKKSRQMEQQAHD